MTIAFISCKNPNMDSKPIYPTHKEHRKNQYRKDENTRAQTPTDPSKLTSSARRRLLEKRIQELEENERRISTLQLEMAQKREKSRNSQVSQHSQFEKSSGHYFTDTVDKERYILASKLSSITSPIREDDVPDSHNRNNRDISNLKTEEGVQYVLKRGRSQRTSILNKAERLLNERKRREFNTSSDGDSDRPRDSYLSKNVTYVAKRSRSKSPINDTQFVLVPEVVENDEPSIYRNQNVLPQHGRLSVPSVTKSEIPILYSDDDDVYPELRPLSDTEQNRYPNYRRYEQTNNLMRINYRDPAHKKIGRASGALVKFFRNGDVDHKGIPLTVNRSFRNLETLLVYLNDKIPTPTGVKYVFKWPEGTEIKSITEFQNRCVYIVSSTRNLCKDISYGDSREGYWSNKKPSAGRLRKNEVVLYKSKSSPHQESPIRNVPLIVTIINNLSREKREKVILNPNTKQSFEEWLEDISNHDTPVRTLFCEKPPFAEVKSFSHLFKELRLNSNFIACGDELLPVEIDKKRKAQSSNSSTDSFAESVGQRKKLAKQLEMGQIFENGGAESHRTTSMSRYDAGPRYPPPAAGPRARQADGQRNMNEKVEIEIDGVIREFIPPTYADPTDDGAKPDKVLKCDWVYGFRGRDTRHNLIVLPQTGELVYYVAAIVVLYDKERGTQRHYIKHNEEITCMVLHPNQFLIATGQLHGNMPEHSTHIRIWHGISLSTISVIGLGVFVGGILSIGFSHEGSGIYMCALDGSDKHVLSVWEWQTERVIARTTTTTDLVHYACFYPDGANKNILITYGARHIYFWKLFYDVARRKEAKILRDRNSGIFEERNYADHLIEDVPNSINCIAFLFSGDIVTGDTSGNIMVWDKDATDAFTCKFAVQAHNASIMSICLMEDGTLLTGSKHEIKAWDTNSNFKAVKTRQIPPEAGSIRCIVTQNVGGIDGQIYIGTTKSTILDGSMQLKFRFIVQGHSDGVWGVIPHPFEPTFISAGFDQVAFKWSLVTHKVIWRSQVEAPCTAVSVDHKHEVVAIGTSQGTFIVLNAYNGMHIATVQVGTEPIGCLAFSPDGTLLAIGCNDGLINIFSILDRGQTYRKFSLALRGHTNGVAHLDWSSDGRCIQSVSFDHELLFWDIDSMQQIRITRMMRDMEWFTNTCHVAFSLIGPWSNLEKGELLKVVNRSHYRDLLITGDSKGRIRLFKYPCSKEKAEYKGVRVYSSDVTAVAFTPDNRAVLSCGGNDAALVQWSLVDEQ